MGFEHEGTAWCFAPEMIGDAAAAAALHAGQIGEGFLTFLGPRFLRRLYRRVARTPGSFLLVVEDEGDNGWVPRRLHRCRRSLSVLHVA